jgi:hypothetical protein
MVKRPFASMMISVAALAALAAASTAFAQEERTMSVSDANLRALMDITPVSPKIDPKAARLLEQVYVPNGSTTLAKPSVVFGPPLAKDHGDQSMRLSFGEMSLGERKVKLGLQVKLDEPRRDYADGALMKSEDIRQHWLQGVNRESLTNGGRYTAKSFNGPKKIELGFRLGWTWGGEGGGFSVDGILGGGAVRKGWRDLTGKDENRFKPHP